MDRPGTLWVGAEAGPDQLLEQPAQGLFRCPVVQDEFGFELLHAADAVSFPGIGRWKSKGLDSVAQSS